MQGPLRVAQTLHRHFDLGQEPLRLVTSLSRLLQHFDFLQLWVTKDAHSFRAIVQPGVPQNLKHGRPFLWIFQQHVLDQVASLSRHLGFYIFGELEFGFDHALFELADAVAFEWHHSAQHRVQANSETPYISLLAAELSIAQENFWSHVSRSATLIFDQVFGAIEKLRYAEVTNFNSAFIVQKQIFQLNVTMKHSIPVAIG